MIYLAGLVKKRKGDFRTAIDDFLETMPDLEYLPLSSARRYVLFVTEIPPPEGLL